MTTQSLHRHYHDLLGDDPGIVDLFRTDIERALRAEPAAPPRVTKRDMRRQMKLLRSLREEMVHGKRDLPRL